VFVGGDDVALKVASAGFAKVKPASSSSSKAPSSYAAHHDELVAASAAAEAAGRGIFARANAEGTAVAAADAVAASASGPRHFNGGGNSSADAEAAAEALLAAAGGKGSKLRGIVEYVSSGSSMRATLFAPTKSGLSRGGVLPARGVPLILTGAVCPSMATPKSIDAAPSAAAATAPAPPAPALDPYAPVARHFTESRLLHRDALVTLHGLDKHGNVVASISVNRASNSSSSPPPSSSSETPAASLASVAASEDIALSLVRAGLARAAEWGLSMLPTPQEAAALREAERGAKARRAGVWKNWAPPAGAAAKATGSFRGVVAEVVSGDVLMIRDEASGVERRLCLASIKAPRLGRRDPATGRVEGGEAFAAEAKEFLRSRLIGKAVDVKLEYERKVPVVGAGGGERLLSFAAVTLPPPPNSSGSSSSNGSGSSSGANVAELLLSRGLASCARHRADDERASGYDALLDAEAQARAKRRGVHGAGAGGGEGGASAAAKSNGAAAAAVSSSSSASPSSTRINDVSGPGSAARAKAYLPSFTRNRSVQAVVEHVLSGHRLKLSIPKESVVVAFALADVRINSSSNSNPSNPASNAPNSSADPVAAEAMALVRKVALQRDVEVEVEACDRGGTFLGTLRIPSSSPSGSPDIDLATLLVKAGLAKVALMAAADGGPRVEALQRAQREAQQARRGSWRDWVPAAEAAAEAEAAASATAGAAAGDGDLSSSSSKPFERLSVVVTDVRSFDDISVQIAGEPRVEWIAATLRGAALDEASSSLLGGPPAQGSLVAGKFSADGQFYRARVESATADGGARVTFVDFGNSETLPPTSLRRLPAELGATPPQALAAKLSFVKKPPSASASSRNDDGDDFNDDDDEFALAASELVASALGGGAPLEALVVSRSATARSGGPGKALSLVLVLEGGEGEGDKEEEEKAGSDADDDDDKKKKDGKSKNKNKDKKASLSTREAAARSVNAELLRAGLLRLDRPRFAARGGSSSSSSPSVPAHLSETLSALEEAQDAARRGRRGIWEYGDPGGDSEDEGERRGGGRGGWGSRR